MLLTDIGPFLSRQQAFDHHDHLRKFLCPSLHSSTALKARDEGGKESSKNHLRHQLRAPHLQLLVAVIAANMGNDTSGDCKVSNGQILFNFELSHGFLSFFLYARE
jgi:hypothetical protein